MYIIIILISGYMIMIQSASSFPEAGSRINSIPKENPVSTIHTQDDSPISTSESDKELYSTSVEDYFFIAKHNLSEPETVLFPDTGQSRQFNYKSKLSTSGDIAFGSLLVIFCFLSVIGNGLSVIMFFFRPRRLSPAEVFLVNLAIVDILLSCASYPMSTISSFKHEWSFGEIGCTFYAFTCYFLGVASIYSVTAVAIIRYIKTCTHALGTRVTCRTSLKMILFGYLLSLVWAGLPLLDFGHYGFEPYGTSCTLEWISADTASTVYIILVSVFCVVLPVTIILFCYAKIVLLVRKSSTLMETNGVKQGRKRLDNQLTLISGLVTLGFIIGWCPYSIVSLWASYRGEVVLPLWATPIPVLLAKSSIAYNPFIYIFLTARYREDIRQLAENWGFTAKPNSNVRPGSTCRKARFISNLGRVEIVNTSGDTSGCGNMTETVQTTNLASASTSTQGDGNDLQTDRLHDPIQDDNSSEEHTTSLKKLDSLANNQIRMEIDMSVDMIAHIEKSGDFRCTVSTRDAPQKNSDKLDTSI